MKPQVPRCAGVEFGKPISIGDNVCFFLLLFDIFEKNHSNCCSKKCWFGGGVIVCPGVKIGSNCVIGAGAVVTKDVPDYCVAAGNPAKVIKHLQNPNQQ